MTLADFNIMMRGHAERMRMERENLVTQAWYTAMFTNAEKLKDLDYYIKDLRESSYNDEPVDVEKALYISEQIEKLKGVKVDE